MIQQLPKLLLFGIGRIFILLLLLQIPNISGNVLNHQITNQKIQNPIHPQNPSTTCSTRKFIFIIKIRNQNHKTETEQELDRLETEREEVRCSDWEDCYSLTSSSDRDEVITGLKSSEKSPEFVAGGEVPVRKDEEVNEEKCFGSDDGGVRDEKIRNRARKASLDQIVGSNLMVVKSLCMVHMEMAYAP